MEKITITLLNRTVGINLIALNKCERIFLGEVCNEAEGELQKKKKKKTVPAGYLNDGQRRGTASSINTWVT